MAELTQEVRNRYSGQFLTELTNQDQQGDVTALAINTTVLEAAAADTKAQFLTEAGTVYDGDDAQHISICVLGTIYFLHQFTGRYTDALQQAREVWINALRRYSQRSGERRRLLPKSGSNLTPSSEVAGTRPDFDRSRWEDVVPNMPPGGSDSTGGSGAS